MVELARDGVGVGGFRNGDPGIISGGGVVGAGGGGGGERVSFVDFRFVPLVDEDDEEENEDEQEEDGEEVDDHLE